MAGPGPAQGQVLPPALAPAGGAQTVPTPLLDALIARGLDLQPAAGGAQSPTPLEGYPQLPNPDPNSAPPLYGEPPGLGYLYAREAEFRQAALVDTSPELVRKMILRSMEVVAQNVLLPFNEEGAAKNADALLRMAQAYLLIDPSVDAEGVPVAAKAMGQAQTQVVGAVARAEHAPPAQGGEAHGTVKRKVTKSGHAEPPKVVPGAAGQALEKMHENLQQILAGDRGSKPLPRPRPSA